MKVPDGLLGWLEEEAKRAHQTQICSGAGDFAATPAALGTRQPLIWRRTCAAVSRAACATFPATRST